ncbi:bacteriophage protein [Burkholderia pseudomallei]|nr:bacteriophage protein [Burkholderia pseudomallei]CAJ5218072.1 bacteriophage protein [Burkholderia pseudomallei]CAJ7339174.1 bacteriophage protein [Burkholderia pseudomallei]CAJ8693127.1 bacteriophage protein [Burkholderia pseudomallei]
MRGYGVSRRARIRKNTSGDAMKKVWQCLEVGFALCALGIVALFLVYAFKLHSNDAAGWVQAVGSIAGIFIAIWIAGSQHRADVARRADEDARSEYLLEAELAWLSTEVVGFLGQFRDIKAGFPIEDRFSEDDVRDLLDRLSWCRQRARHKTHLWMVGELRSSLMGTVRAIRSKMAHTLMVLTDDDVKLINDLRLAAIEVSDLASRAKAILGPSAGA